MKMLRCLELSSLKLDDEFFAVMSAMNDSSQVNIIQFEQHLSLPSLFALLLIPSIFLINSFNNFARHFSFSFDFGNN